MDILNEQVAFSARKRKAALNLFFMRILFFPDKISFQKKDWLSKIFKGAADVKCRKNLKGHGPHNIKRFTLNEPIPQLSASKKYRSTFL